jgi:hypothetical protein
MRIYKDFFCLAGIAFACTNIDDASISTRNTFIHLYQGPINFTASDILEISDGYLILGNLLQADGSQETIVIKSDFSGNMVGDIHYYAGGTGKVIKPFSNSNFSGYLIIGDSIKIDPNAADVSDIEVASARILAINEDLDSIATRTFSDKVNPFRKTDIKGASLTINEEDGGVIVLITYEAFSAPVKPWLIALNNEDLRVVDWEYQFNGLVRDYIAGKSIHHYNNSTILASSLLRQQGNFNEKYLSIVRVEDYLTEGNAQFLGENLDKSFAANDIQPAHSLSFGFGVVGTSSETDGTNKNMFFTRVGVDGSLGIPPDTIYIDSNSGLTSSSTSDIEDTGQSLSSTSDGGFILAGTMQTTAISGKTIGSGGGDIFLTKVNASNSIMWTRLIGGTGDEIVSTIREASDGGLLICGTNIIGGYSTIFLIKTDQNGELKN